MALVYIVIGSIPRGLIRRRIVAVFGQFLCVAPNTSSKILGRMEKLGAKILKFLLISNCIMGMGKEWCL